VAWFLFCNRPAYCRTRTTQDLPAGQVLLRVPLRLAVTDVMSGEERQRVVGEVCVTPAGRVCCPCLGLSRLPPVRACVCIIGAGASAQHCCLLPTHLNPDTTSASCAQGALWQDRLVAKLLQECQKGPASAWAPYLQVCLLGWHWACRHHAVSAAGTSEGTTPTN
jgi:hypothetical protein